MQIRSWASGVLAVGALSIVLAAQPARFSFDDSAIAGRVVEKLTLQPGERVLLVAMPGRFEDLVPHLRHAVMRAGGVDRGVIDVLREPARAPFRPRRSPRPRRR